jgi:transcriptional regulator
MYIPKPFAVNELAEQHALIHDHEFGIMVSGGTRGLFATHAPFLLKQGEGRLGTLYAHVAAANPHVEDLRAGVELLVVFSGPHAYVSPRWYENRSTNVPTWNYLAVHVYGRPAVIGEDAAVEQLLDQLLARYETGGDGWRQAEIAERPRAELRRAIVAFRLPIERIEAKAKLSQNKSRSDRGRVAAALERSGQARLAQLMRSANSIAL